MDARSTSDPVRPGALPARLTGARRLALALLLAVLVGMIGLGKATFPIAPADQLAMKIVAHLHWLPGAGWVTALSQGLDRLGSGGASIGIALLIALFLARAGRPGAVLWLLVAICGLAVLNPLMKMMFAVPRPTMIDHLVIASGDSFPSGHAAGAMTLYGALALLWRAPPFQLVCAGLIAAEGLSRVWLGVHWPSDVIGGWMEGAAWLLVMSFWRLEQRPR